jgi:hypothetical protein
MAERDRSHWPMSIGSLREMEGEVADLSKTTTCEEHFAMMWQLAQDAWAFRGEPIGEPYFRDLLLVLSAAGVEVLVLTAYAFALHALYRASSDLELWPTGSRTTS